LPASYYVGAIAVGGMLFNIIYWMFGFLRMGTGGETAQAWGRRDLDGVVLLLVRNLLLALVLALVLMIASPLIRDVALWYIAPEAEVASLARTYYNICIWGAIPALGLFAMNGWYIGMQNSRFPMIVAIGQNLLNIACSIFFVYALGMRIEGVALGTLLAQWVAFAIALLLCLRYYQRLWHRKTFSMPPLSLLLRQVVAPGTISNRQNLSLFLRTLCLIVVHFMFIAAGAAQGSMALAVNTLLMQLFTMFSYFMDGFAYAGEALVGKAVGACNRNACHTIVRRLFMWGGVVSLLFVALYAIGGNAFMSLLTDDTSVLDTLSHYRLWTLLLPICGVASFLWDGIYIGATAPRLMLLSMVISMCVFLVGYYFLIPLWGNHALWLSFLSYLACRGMVQTCTRAKIFPKPFGGIKQNN
jgi:MATE family multidrug resistance protein